jgi:hypothetical protein
VLYEHDEIELPQRYDPDTGKDEISDLRGQDAYSQAIEDAEKLQSLKGHAGWKLLEGWLASAVTSYSEALIHELDPSKVRRLQEAIKSYRNVTSFIEYKLEEAEFAKKQLEDLAERDKPAGK